MKQEQCVESKCSKNSPGAYAPGLLDLPPPFIFLHPPLCSLVSIVGVDFVSKLVDLLHLHSYSLLTNSVRSVIDAQASSIASCSREIDRMSRYFVHSFCVEVSVVRHSSLLTYYVLHEGARNK